MTERGNERERISGRAALAASAIAIVAATAPRRAAAQQKISQAVAKYQDMPGSSPKWRRPYFCRRSRDKSLWFPGSVCLATAHTPKSDS